MSKNLFNYAKKELSQDAFLMWLIDSYNSENAIEKTVSRKFLKFLANIPEDEELMEVWVKPQWCKIDVTAFVSTKTEKIGIFIEDKTTSNEHNQLLKYNKSINNIEYWEKGKLTSIKKLFYKTNSIDDDERNRIKSAGWEEIPFEKINNFWHKFVNVDHLIISQYAKHITSIYDDSKNVVVPKDNNVIAWKSFFEKIVKPVFEDTVDSWVSITMYNYACFCIRPKGKGNIKMPYLEIRSRDCLGGSFNAKILMYGVDFSNNSDGLKEIRDIIRVRENNKIFKGNYGEKQNKQVAHTIKGTFKQNSNDDFIDKVKIVMNEYLEIVSFWK